MTGLKKIRVRKCEDCENFPCVQYKIDDPIVLENKVVVDYIDECNDIIKDTLKSMDECFKDNVLKLMPLVYFYETAIAHIDKDGNIENLVPPFPDIDGLKQLEEKLLNKDNDTGGRSESN